MQEDITRLTKELAQIERLITKAEEQARRGGHSARQRLAELQERAEQLRTAINIGGSVASSNVIVGHKNRVVQSKTYVERVEGNVYHVAQEAARPRVPLQRPPRAEHFTGRREDIKQLLRELRTGQIITRCGPGGIGKTPLVTEVLWQLAPGDEPPSRFPDGIIFYSFYNQPQAELALEHIARSFGEEIGQGLRRDAAFRALDGRRALLVLDGTEEADDLRSVLTVQGKCGVLITSRSHKDAVSTYQNMTPLPIDEAVTLLQAWGQQRATDKKVVRSLYVRAGLSK